jgi:hypothetical protein
MISQKGPRDNKEKERHRAAQKRKESCPADFWKVMIFWTKP